MAPRRAPAEHYRRVGMSGNAEVLVPFETAVNDLTASGGVEEHILAEALSERLIAVRVKLAGDENQSREALRELEDIARGLANMGVLGRRGARALHGTVDAWRSADVRQAEARQDAAVMSLNGLRGAAGEDSAFTTGAQVAVGLGLIAVGLALRRIT